MKNKTALKLLTLSILAVIGTKTQAEDGYSALGIRAGSFMLFPAFENENKWSDNIFYRQGNNSQSDFLFHLKPSLNINSNWGRHALNFSAGADAMFYKDYSTEDRQNYFANLDGRFDVMQDSFATAKFYYQHNTENRGSPGPIANRSVNPLENDTLGGTVGYEHKFNRLRINLSHDINHTEYQDGIDPFGNAVLNSQRSRMTNTTTVRLGYELFSGYEAYITGSYNFVDYDQLMSINNNWTSPGTLDRSSQGYQIAAGVKADISHVLVADAHLGYRHQEYNSSLLNPIDGISGGLALTWLPTRLTTVTVAVDRNIMETTQPALQPGQAPLSGYFSTNFSANIDHELMRNVFLNVHGSYMNNDYKGAWSRQDDLFNGGFNVKYLVNRYLYLKAGYDYFSRESNVNNQNYDINNVYLTIGTQL